MDSGLYAACSGLVARTQALDLAANNLANASTTAYRAEQPTFHAALASHGLRTADARSAALNQFSVIGSTRVDLAQGNLESTGNPLDLAIVDNKKNKKKTNTKTKNTHKKKNDQKETNRTKNTKTISVSAVSSLMRNFPD